GRTLPPTGLAARGRRPAPRERPGRLLRTAGNRQDLPRASPRHVPDRHSGRGATAGAVPPVLRLRGLLRGIPPTAWRHAGLDRVRPGAWPTAPHGGARRSGPDPAIRPRDRRAEPSEPRQGVRRVVLPPGVP